MATIAIDSSGTPYVGFVEGKASVMKYNGSGWVYVGTPGFSDSLAGETSIAIDGSGTPYIAYMVGFAYKATVMKYNGSSWVLLGSEGFSGTAAWYTSIVIDKSGIPYVAYQDGGGGGPATVMKYNGSDVGAHTITVNCASLPQAIDVLVHPIPVIHGLTQYQYKLVSCCGLVTERNVLY